MLCNLIPANAPRWEKSSQLERLNRRIADVRLCIEEAQRHSQIWFGSDSAELLALLYTTLQDLEAHKAALESANQ